MTDPSVRDALQELVDLQGTPGDQLNSDEYWRRFHLAWVNARAALKAAQPVPPVRSEEVALLRHEAANRMRIAATPAPQEPAEPVAWPSDPELIAMWEKCDHQGLGGLPTGLRFADAIKATQSVADAQDAGRYRWLKDKSGFDIRSLLDVGDFTSLNAHIDAAMALDVTKRDPKGD
jgi:hypothetical protein